MKYFMFLQPAENIAAPQRPKNQFIEASLSRLEAHLLFFFLSHGNTQSRGSFGTGVEFIPELLPAASGSGLEGVV